MSSNPLLLYELLSPYFLAGFRFSDEADRILSFLAVDELHMSSDETDVTYYGRMQFIERDGQTASFSFTPPGAGVLEWDDLYVEFRLSMPRDGAAFINTAITATPVTQDLLNLFADFGLVNQTPATSTAPIIPTEYPGIQFRLELLFSLMSFKLGQDWLPGTIDPVSRRIVPDLDATGSVKFVIPKMVFEYEQGNTLNAMPAFRLKSWGSGGLDAPADIEQGEIVRMEPPIAVHRNGRYGFGVDQVLIDLSQDNTPPEIMEQFGTDEAFQGLFLKSIRFYYTDEKKDAGFGIAIQDALISFAGEVSFEASLDIYTSRPGMDIEPRLYSNGDLLDLSKLPVVLDNVDDNVLHVHLSGGYEEFHWAVKLHQGMSTFPLQQSQGRPGEWILSKPSAKVAQQDGDYTLHISVIDSAPDTPNQAEQEIPIKFATTAADSLKPGEDGLPADRPALEPAVTYMPPKADSVRDGYRIVHEGPGGNLTERIRIIGGDAIVKVGSQSIPVDAGGLALVPVPINEKVEVTVVFPDIQPGMTTFKDNVLFEIDRPLDENDMERYINLDPSGVSTPYKQYGKDSEFVGRILKLKNWMQANKIGSPVHLVGHASYENLSNAESDEKLSKRRVDVVQAILLKMDAGLEITPKWHGHTQKTGYKKEEDRRVVVTGKPLGVPESQTTLQFTRESNPAVKPPSQPRVPVHKQVPAPPQEPNKAPTWLKRLGFRVRFERNVPVMFELSGQIDFDTQMESKRRKLLQSNTPNMPVETTGDQTALSLKARPGANSLPDNPDDGVVDFVLHINYDTSTRLLTEKITLGAAPGDKDGLLEGVYSSNDSQKWKDIVGALLLFAPIIQDSADKVDRQSPAGDIAQLAISIALPITIASLGIFRTTRLTLYGGELKMRQYVPKDDSEKVLLTDSAIVFDYGIEFMISLEKLGIEWNRPVKVRYKAIGFNIAYHQPDKFQPIFDTSKGYEINLGDPGQASLPKPLDQLLSVVSARVARVNPVIFEVDLAVKANLGIITVDRFKVRVSLENPAQISIQPAGVRIEIPQTVSGSGYVEIIDKTENNIQQKGFAGTIDITLIPMKLRAAASLAINAMKDVSSGREAIGTYLGITVEFPAPIVLGATGLGIFGFSGLFAMHYRRTENPPVPGSPISPALEWLIKADGEPARLTHNGVVLWEPSFDRWSFGVGIVLGTLEGGFLMNFRGMFVLELPGPRILIFTKIQVVQKLPDMTPADDLNVGMLGVLDLDFNLGQITVGVVIDFTIKRILQATVPIEIFFSLKDSKNWHLHIGRYDHPITADILEQVKGHGYFMMAGNGIPNFPLPDGTVIQLHGMSVAAGIGASVVYGYKEINLYLEVAARADVGISFLPEKMFFAGGIKLEGKLVLFILSVGAEGTLTVIGPDPTYIHGKIKGRKKLLFYTLEGEVTVTIGQQDKSFPVPDLIKKVYLQSFAPVLLAGQGGDRPIDGSLGDAHTVLKLEDGLTRTVMTEQGVITLNEHGQAEPEDRSKVLTVPIDSVIVAQFGVVPDVTEQTKFFTDKPGTPNSTVDGWIGLGSGRKARYILKDVKLSPVLLPESPKAPSVWRREVNTGAPNSKVEPPSQGPDTQINLAMMSRTPSNAEYAVERSTDLTHQIDAQWKSACTPVAPPACVLWTFCGKPIGPSGTGWQLNNGIPVPDPIGTERSTPPPVKLVVEEPGLTIAGQTANAMMAEAGLPYDIPARIVGVSGNIGSGDRKDRGERTCFVFSHRKRQMLSNPWEEQKFRITSLNAEGKPNSYQLIHEQTGLSLSATTIIEFPPSSEIQLHLVSGATPFKLTAMDASGNPVAYAGHNGQPTTQVVNLSGAMMAKVQIDASSRETILAQICRTVPTEVKDNDAILGTTCMRALQMPAIASKSGSAEVEEEVVQFANDRLGERWITLHTGGASQISVLMAADPQSLGSLLVRELDTEQHMVAEQAVTAWTLTPVQGIDQLPLAWKEPNKPWRKEVEPVLALFGQPQYKGMLVFLMDLKPDPKTERIMLRFPQHDASGGLPGVLIGAVAVCSLAEQRRYKHELEIKNTNIQTVENYLNNDQQTVLLEPDRDYVLTIEYDTEANNGEDPIIKGSKKQEFYFRTDAEPPKRLQPYVLGTSPQENESYHFYEDRLNLVFNDKTVLQLYEAYGYQLRTVVRSSDGVPVRYYDPETGVEAPESGSTITELETIDNLHTSPYYDLMKKSVETGEVLACQPNPDIKPKPHGMYKVPVELRPRMSYTLDVELVDMATGQPAALPSDDPVAPFYRRRFTTSRYAGMEEIGQEMSSLRARHRALQGPIDVLGAYDSVMNCESVEDDVLQQELLKAGEQAMPGAEAASFTVYWRKKPDHNHYSPYAILLDCPEPLWRWRDEPELLPVPHQDDEEFKMLVPGRTSALRIQEHGSSHVTRYVRSTSGTRTIAFFSDAYQGDKVHLMLQRDSSLLYNIEMHTVPLLAIQTGLNAPWEEENLDD